MFRMIHVTILAVEKSAAYPEERLRANTRTKKPRNENANPILPALTAHSSWTNALKQPRRREPADPREVTKACCSTSLRIKKIDL